MTVKFQELLTKALEETSVQYITGIPRCILNDSELKFVDYIKKCLNEGWVPDPDDVSKSLRFVPMTSKKPLKVLHKQFTESRRDTFIAESIREFIKKNEEEGNEPYEGLSKYQLELLEKSAIGNPEIIDYGALPRESYIKNVMRTSFHLPYFDQMANGLNGGDFIVIMAGTKGYKTTLLKYMTQAAYYKGEDVVFCSQEQATLSMSQQFDMQALEKVHSGLRGGITEEQLEELKELQLAFAEMENKMYITPQVTSVAQLHEYIVSLNRPIKKIFIDGLNLMQGDSADSFTSLQKVSADLKRYAIEHNLVIIAVTQTNREGYKAGGAVGAQHLAGSFAIGQYADLLIVLSNLYEDNQTFVYIRPILNRNGDLLTKIRMHPIIDGIVSQVEFNLLKPEFGTEQSSEFSLASSTLKANFRNITGGLSFDEVTTAFGQAAADELLSSAVSLEEEYKKFEKDIDVDSSDEMIKF